MVPAALKEPLIGRFLSFRSVAVLSGVTMLLLLLSCAAVLLQSRHELVRRADQMAHNVLVLAEETVRVEVNRYDTRMLDVLEALRGNALAVPPVDGPNTALFGGVALRGDIGDILVVDHTGAILRSSLPELTGSYAKWVADILANPGSGPNGLSIRTIQPAGGGGLVIALSRRCLATQCGAAAAVIAMMPLSGVLNVFDRLILGRQGVISLWDTDGVLLARRPDAAAKVGLRVIPTGMLAGLRHGQTASNDAVSRVDHIRRRYTSGWVGYLPLVVSVGISTADVSQGWAALAAVVGVVVVVLSAGFVLLTLLLAREVRRKTMAEREVMAANLQLSELARTDQLTGLLNRRGFDENLAREWRRARRAGKAISLLLLDADHFKAYNDRYGHQAGDRILRTLCDVTVGQIRRPGDVAARYGGEEFAVVLPDTDGYDAGRIAENIRAAVEAMAVTHPENGGCVTVSIGVSWAWPGREDPSETLIQVADAALYESKNLGRNRVTSRRVIPLPAAAPSLS